MFNRIKFYCARCRKPVYAGETEGVSGIYKSRHLLCESCFFHEDAQIEHEGMNDLPETLAKYGESNMEPRLL